MQLIHWTQNTHNFRPCMGCIFKKHVTDSVDYSYRSHIMVVNVGFNQCPNKVPLSTIASAIALTLPYIATRYNKSTCMCKSQCVGLPLLLCSIPHLCSELIPPCFAFCLHVLFYVIHNGFALLIVCNTKPHYLIWGDCDAQEASLPLYMHVAMLSYVLLQVH